MNRSATRMVCAGCGSEVPPEEPRPFRCPEAGRRGSDDVDHVLRRHLEPDLAVPGSSAERRALFVDREPQPFLRYRRLLHTYHVARRLGLTEDDWGILVAELDAAVERLDGRGFRCTPFAPRDRLAEAVGLEEGALWVKDETGNVSGSHKARHLFGVMLWLEARSRLDSSAGEPHEAQPLAIASCGNAALAAAVVARAARRSLDVFVPPDAHRAVLERLGELGARLHVCERPAGAQAGDPCYLGFRRASARGALPFTCQGNENGLVIEGGATLGYEMVSELLRRGESLDHVFVQVGGGALASAVVLALRDARSLGLIDRLPRIHTVQTGSAFPLQRAWDRVVERVAMRRGETLHGSRWETADRFAGSEARPIVAEELRYAARHRSEFMRPWEGRPHSVATGILDDETYDWLAVVEGMLETGGVPLVVSEASLLRANDLAARHTSVPVDPTGSSGLAGLLEAREDRRIPRGESVAVLFTGVRR